MKLFILFIQVRNVERVVRVWRYLARSPPPPTTQLLIEVHRVYLMSDGFKGFR